MTDNRFAQYPQVNFRAGDLEPALRARGESLALVARRDLTRYYHALSEALPTFAPNEALLMADALNGTLIEPHTARLVWAEIDDAVRLDGLAVKWGVDGPALIRRLRDDLTPFERLSVCDAVERAWRVTEQDAIDMGEALRRVGLVR